MPWRVFMLITDLEVGGTPLDVLRLATALDPRQFHLKVVSLAPPGPVSERLAAAGIDCDACGARGRGDLRALWRLFRLVSVFRPHLLHSFLFHANLAARVVGPMAGVPARRIVCEIKTIETQRRWHLWLDTLTARACRFQVANSPAVAEHLRRQGHWPAGRLRTILSAVDVEAIARAQPVSRQSLRLTERQFVVLWVGRFDPAKSLETLVEAASLLDPKLAVRFVLAGQGQTRQRIEDLVEDRGLSEQFQFLGTRDDVPALLKTCDLLVLPSRTEGLPTVLIEAMAAGCPVLASDIPACRQAVQAGLAARLVTPDRPTDWAEAIAACATGDRPPPCPKPLSAAVKRFGLERLVRDYVDLYASVLRWPGQRIVPPPADGGWLGT